MPVLPVTPPPPPRPAYWFNGRVHAMAGGGAGPSPHLLAWGGRVWHSDASPAPMGLDFRAPDFAATRRRLAADVDFHDLAGRTVLPGFTDSHVHFLWWAMTLTEADLTGARDETDAAARVAAHAAARPGASGGAGADWITGHGWSHNAWPGGGLPSRASLDAAAPDRPALLASKCGHLAWANSAALAAAGIGDATPAPEGGAIERDTRGRATGILKENAIALVRSRVPEPTFETRRHAFLHAQAVAHGHGITSMQTPEDLETFAFLQAMRAAGELTMRVDFWIPASALPHLADLRVTHGLGDGLLRIGAVKLFADGSLGGRTALMRTPYEGEPGNTGIATATPEEIMETTLAANRAGLPMAIHAIGDRAVDNVLAAYEAAVADPVSAGHPGRGGGGRGGRGPAPVRNRIEHIQVFDPDILPRLARLRPTCSVQPVHLCADMGPADRWWGGRARHAYAFRTLADAGCPLAFGSDAPVETIDPWAGIAAATRRLAEDGSGVAGGWQPDEKLDYAEALAGYTTGAAAAAGLTGVTGRLTPGARADFQVFDTDPAEVIAAAVTGGRVVMRPVAVFSGGRCVAGST